MASFLGKLAQYWDTIGYSENKNIEDSRDSGQNINLQNHHSKFQMKSVGKMLNLEIDSISQQSSPNQQLLSTTDIENFGKFMIKQNGTKWTSQEDEQLKSAVQKFNGKEWKEIAQCVKGRSRAQCAQRWRRIKENKSKRKWTHQEDELILKLSETYGKNWQLIANQMPGRTSKQVRDRFLNKLDPKLVHDHFTPQDDYKIIELYAQYGHKWEQIAQHFVGRPGSMIKNRFYSSIKKQMAKSPHQFKHLFDKYDTQSSIMMQDNLKQEPQLTSNNNFENYITNNNGEQFLSFQKQQQEFIESNHQFDEIKLEELLQGESNDQDIVADLIMQNQENQYVQQLFQQHQQYNYDMQMIQESNSYYNQQYDNIKETAPQKIPQILFPKIEYSHNENNAQSQLFVQPPQLQTQQFQQTSQQNTQQVNELLNFDIEYLNHEKQNLQDELNEIEEQIHSRKIAN